MRKAEAKEFYSAGLVWNIWADYWTHKVPIVPPFSYLRVGGSGDYIFATTVSDADLDGFIQAVKGNADFKFQAQGNWWLPTHYWFGTWKVFSASVRQPFFGFDRGIYASNEVLDFNRSGDSRMTPLRSDRELNEPPV